VVAYAAAGGAQCDPKKWIWNTWWKNVILNICHSKQLSVTPAFTPKGQEIGHQRYAKVGHICKYSKLILLQKYFGPIISRWRMPAAAQNVTPKNGYGTPGERRQDGWTLREIFTERKGLIFLYVHTLHIAGITVFRAPLPTHTASKNSSWV
jgi:hypothetical protein